MIAARLLALALAAAPFASAAGEFFTLSGHGGPIMDIAVSEEGRIATASFDNALGLWEGDAPSWRDGHEAAVNVVRFIGSGQTLVSGGDDFAVRLWPEQGAPAVLGTHQGKVMGLAFNAQTSTIASASWDGSIGVFRLAPRGGTLLDGAWEPEMTLLEGHDAGVNAVVFSPDGSRLYSASADGTIRLWDMEEGVELAQFVRNGFGINEMVLDTDAGWLAYGALDGVTRVVDLETGEQIADFTLDRRPILAMAYHRESNAMAVGDGEGFIMVIDTANWRIARDFRATTNGPIWALAFSRDGENVHAGGIEPVLYSWPITSLDELSPIEGGAQSFLVDPGTVSNGERQFQRKCSICHTLTPGTARRAGPSLYDVFGRRAGTVDDYVYSPALDGSEIIWDANTIDALFDIGPEHYIPGTKMPMQRITGAQDRADLIDFLKRATAPEETK